MNHQDWKPVILRKTNTQLKKEEKVKKTTVLNPKGPNSKKTDINAKKLDSDEIQPIKFIPKETAKNIQQARIAKKITQQELANRLNVKKTIINDLESGKMILDKSFINKVEKKLGIK